MAFSFATIPAPKIRRSVFDRSKNRKMPMSTDYLYPCFLDEVLPGDSFKMRATAFLRLMPIIAPIIDQLWIDIHFFFVPFRLVWDSWVKMCGEQVDPDDSTDYTVPQFAPQQTPTVGSIWDYMGLPPGISGLSVSALPFRAYNLIYNCWYRDQNLIDSLPVQKGDSTETSGYSLQKRCKKHDYLTSCLPWPQKGDEVTLPIGESAPVVGNGIAIGIESLSGSIYGLYRDAGTQSLICSTTLEGRPIGTSVGTTATPTAGFALGLTDDPQKSGMVADLSNATAASINELRQAFQVQRMLERDARGGTRYVELLRSHFGVVCPDYRVQRPEYLGGMSSVVQITPVPQTSAPDANNPLGQLAANGISASTGGFTKTFVEHGLILGIASIRQQQTYQQGIHRMWSRLTRWDFYWPSLANLGEQPVYNREIFAQGTAADSQVFGYQERWAEYRYSQNEVVGVLRSQAASSLDYWHLAQNFGTLPTLGKDFIEETVDMARVLQVPSEPAFIADLHFDLRCARPMPVYSIPGLIDHL